jgi:hypothetical protein
MIEEAQRTSRCASICRTRKEMLLETVQNHIMQSLKTDKKRKALVDITNSQDKDTLNNEDKDK